MGSVAVKIDCDACDTTGYENPYRVVEATGYYRPGPHKRWNVVSGAVDYWGECGLKMHSMYKSLLDRAVMVKVNDTLWDFSIMRDPGQSLGNNRLVMALTRKE